MKKIFSVILVVALLCGMFPIGTAIAAETEEYIVHHVGSAELHFVPATGTITYVTGSGKLAIPDEVEGVPVVAIGPEAFVMDYAKFSEVIIPDSVQEIGAAAFNYCTTLQSVVLPTNLTELSDGIFCNCKNLKEINIPASVKRIGDSAFARCDTLRTVNLPENLESVGAAAFAECGALREFIFPESVTEIGESVFALCERLERVQLPSNLKEIPAGLCLECPAFKEINIPDGILKIGDSAFYNCKNLEPFDLPDGLREIEKGAFYYCVKFVSLKLPDGLKRIGEKAFWGCSYLKEIDLPESLEYMGDDAFSDCEGIEETNDAIYVDNWLLNPSVEGKGKLIIREGTVGVAEKSLGYTILSNKHLVHVEIPSTVRFLDGMSFQITEHISRIIVDKNNPYFTTENNILYNKDKTRLIFCGSSVDLEETPLQEGLKAIGPYSFTANVATERAVLPDSVEIIEDYAFYCADLCRVEFGEGLKHIGDMAFYECNITGVKFNDALETIGDEAFATCDLTWIILGKNLKTIGKETFAYNNLLKKVELPAALEEVGEAAFFSCIGLKTVIFNGKPPKVGQAAFWYSFTGGWYEPYDLPWCGPIESVQFYYTAPAGWSEFKEYPVALWKQPAVQKYKDVSENQWYASYVDYAVKEGLMNGVGNDNFDPNGSMTRAMLVTVLWRFAGAEEGYIAERYRDVPRDAWYAQAVGWAAAYGIVNGVSDNKFDPDGKITREQLATILYRYSRKLALDSSLKADMSKFKDSKKITDYAQKSMEWAVAAGLINGETKSDGVYLNPQGNATRAQVAAILMRFIENNVKK